MSHISNNIRAFVAGFPKTLAHITQINILMYFGIGSHFIVYRRLQDNLSQQPFVVNRVWRTIQWYPVLHTCPQISIVAVYNTGYHLIDTINMGVIILEYIVLDRSQLGHTSQLSYRHCYNGITRWLHKHNIRDLPSYMKGSENALLISKTHFLLNWKCTP